MYSSLEKRIAGVSGCSETDDILDALSCTFYKKNFTIKCVSEFNVLVMKFGKQLKIRWLFRMQNKKKILNN
jgi:hypothetical protein